MWGCGGCVCVYACLQSFITLCLPLHTFLNPLVKRIVSWLPISHLCFTLFAFREKKNRMPQWALSTTFIMVYISACSVPFKSVAMETFIIFLALNAIVGHNVSFYSVTFSGIRWWKWTQILNEGSDKHYSSWKYLELLIMMINDSLWVGRRSTMDCHKMPFELQLLFRMLILPDQTPK